MKRLRLLCAVGASLALVTFNASAVLVDNGTFTTDTRTGLDWLDIIQTENMSYNQVTAQLGTGGLFEGWVYATNAQVSEFFTSAGGTPPYDLSNTTNIGVVAPLVNLWGPTSPLVGTDSIVFITGDESLSAGSNTRNVGSLGAGISYDQMRLSNTFVPDDIIDPLYGSALVRVSSVPVPGAIWLFGSGFLGLIEIARRRKAT